MGSGRAGASGLGVVAAVAFEGVAGAFPRTYTPRSTFSEPDTPHAQGRRPGKAFNRMEGPMSRRAQVLAERLEQGAGALAKLAESLSDAEWRMKIPHDGRPV